MSNSCSVSAVCCAVVDSQERHAQRTDQCGLVGADAQELGIGPAIGEENEDGEDNDPDPSSATGSGSDEEKPCGLQALPRDLKCEKI